MFGQIDAAGIKATLGLDTWVDDEDSLDVTFLFDKSIVKDLTLREQSKLNGLIALYESER